MLGAARHPLGTTDYSSYILQAQTSGEKIVGLDSTGHDTVNAIKAPHEFGLTPNQKLAALSLWFNDEHRLEKLPLHINDPEFASSVAMTVKSTLEDSTPASS